MKQLSLNHTPMKLTYCFLIAFGLLLGLELTAIAVNAQQLPQSPDAPGAITGVVTNSAGEPLAGIAVSLYRNNEGQLRNVTSDANGSYRFGLLAAGLYQLAFRDPTEQYALQFYGGAPVQAAATTIPVAGQVITAQTVSLAAGSRITGTISHQTGEPLGEVIIEAFAQVQNTWRFVAVSQMPAGSLHYSLGGLPAGTYHICASNLRLAECYNDIVVTRPILAGGAGKAIPLAVGEQRGEINFVLGDSANHGVISGYVRDETGAPLANITVGAYRYRQDGETPAEVRTTQSNAAGYYHLPYLLPGHYLVRLRDQETQRYAEQYYPGAESWQGAQRITVTVGSRVEAINPVLRMGGRVRGQVRIGDEIVTNARLWFYQQRATGWAQQSTFAVDASGAYTATGLSTGVYRVRGEVPLDSATYYGYHGGPTLERAADLQVTVGVTLTQNLVLMSDPDLFAGVISGTVRSDGQPLAGIKVEAIAASSSRVVVYTTTDPHGAYEIAGLPEDHYYLRFSDPQGIYAFTWYRRPGLSTNEPPLRKEDGTTVFLNGATIARGIDGMLSRAGAIQGEVRWANGAPAVGMLVYLFAANHSAGWLWPSCYASDHCAPSIVIDQAGRYQITGLPPGRYHVGFFSSVNDRNGRYYPSRFSLETAEAVIVEPNTVTTGIDSVVGPLPQLFLPFVAR